jgi:F-type H+-transporting ATPase subunit b
LDFLNLLTLAEGEGGLTIFPVIWQSGWTLINFAVFLWIVSKFIFKPLFATVDARQAEIEGNLAKAAEERAAAEKLKADLQREVNEAQKQAQEIVSKATAQAQAAADQLLTEAREKAAEQLRRAEETINTEKQKALAELRAEVANLAVDVAGKVIGRSLTDADHKRMAESFVAEVSN